MLDTLVRHLYMVRLTAAACLLLTVGCTGLIDGGDNGGLTPEEAKARAAWVQQALPRLNAACSSCHGGAREMINFIQQPATDNEIRETLLAYQPAVVNLDAPSSSRLLTKGLHEGPPLSTDDASALLDWIQKERDAAQSLPEGPGIVVVETAQFNPQYCSGGLPGNPEGTCPINFVTLDSLGATGAKISFVAQALGSGLYLTNLKLVPGTSGVFLKHPLFVSYPATGTPVPDSIDRFFNITMNLKDDQVAIEAQQIGGGTAAFVGFGAGPADKLAIHFKEIGLFKPDDGPPPPAGNICKVVGQWATQPKTNLTTTPGGLGQSCLSCHGGQNNNATSALAMNLADDQSNCNQFLQRINKQDRNNSGSFLAVAPGNNNHPVRFATQAQFDAWKAGFNGWIDAEVAAP
ncbi:MAG: hypothetical protein KIT31_18440 [Deltaproteobacteria bacterium]|nr:hypothetical protein [Deltaproteobacteria bacterium]